MSHDPGDPKADSTRNTAPTFGKRATQQQEEWKGVIKFKKATCTWLCDQPVGLEWPCLEAVVLVSMGMCMLTTHCGGFFQAAAGDSFDLWPLLSYTLIISQGSC